MVSGYKKQFFSAIIFLVTSVILTSGAVSGTKYSMSKKEIVSVFVDAVFKEGDFQRGYFEKNVSYVLEGFSKEEEKVFEEAFETIARFLEIDFRKNNKDPNYENSSVVLIKTNSIREKMLNKHLFPALKNKTPEGNRETDEEYMSRVASIGADLNWDTQFKTGSIFTQNKSFTYKIGLFDSNAFSSKTLERFVWHSVFRLILGVQDQKSVHPTLTNYSGPEGKTGVVNGLKLGRMTELDVALLIAFYTKDVREASTWIEFRESIVDEILQLDKAE